jgi:hypothetical protein
MSGTASRPGGPSERDKASVRLDAPTSAEPHYHALVAFAKEASTRLAAQYEQIRATSREDPGTAGDQGEENWRRALMEWLPAELAVVTKGRILGAKGERSPQVDVIVLRPGYPRVLHDNKSYLAGGVLAAFECKVTLRARDIAKAAETARFIRRIAPGRSGTPYAELHSPIIFGVLAHSLEPRRDPLAAVDAALSGALSADSHPRDALDVLCVAALATWKSGAGVLPTWPGWPPPPDSSPGASLERFRSLSRTPPTWVLQNYYIRWYRSQSDHPAAPPPPVYLLFHHLMRRVAAEIELYRPSDRRLLAKFSHWGSSRNCWSRLALGHLVRC